MFLFMLGCFYHFQRFDTPISSPSPWTRSYQVSRFKELWEYSLEHDGRSLLILEGDTLIFEGYAKNHDAQKPLPFWSGTKTLACFLAYSAEKKGLMSLDERVSDTIVEWRSDSLKNNISVRQLLQFTSGLKNRLGPMTIDGLQTPKKQRIKDKYHYVHTLPAQYAPGQRWTYGSAHLTAFADFFERKTQSNVQQWLDREIFAQIDFHYSGWNHDGVGNPMLAYGIWTTALELIKIGVLLRDDGTFRGKNVLPSGLREYCAQSSTQNPAYGLGTWLNEDMPDELPFMAQQSFLRGERRVFHDSDTAMWVFAGAKGQRVYVIPEYDWVVVHQAEEGKTFSDAVFMEILLRKTQR